MTNSDPYPPGSLDLRQIDLIARFNIRQDFT